MKKPEILEILSVAKQFSKFTPEELQALVTAATVRTIQEGEPLWGVGEPRHSAFVLLSGSIERRYPGSSRVVVELVQAPGDVVSWSALVGDAPYRSVSYAKERAKVLVLTREKFLSLFAEDAPVAYAIVDLFSAYLAHDMGAANKRLREIFGRPAETLLMLRRRSREG